MNTITQTDDGSRSAQCRSDAEIADDPSITYAERLAAAMRAMKAGTRMPPSVSRRRQD